MAWLLAKSFAESMFLPSGYVSVLGCLVKQYLFERMELLPNTVTLITFYRRRKEKDKEEEEQRLEEVEEEEDEVELLAGTVEVCFNKKGVVASPPTPTPPKNSPYISNMVMKKLLRRRGIGWHLLKASMELISQMSSSREVYLHCRMIDTAPFNMYKKARYDIVKMDTILVLLLLQRRKHLMCKKLPVLTNFSESDTFCSQEELTP
ncbi:GCN5-related N-acetyltransferase 5, chloroplastic-like [Pyrus communis]|uniref:GCN5-related N-acetyltransferase 5, chloroplastic-like n=1 Tax=Pyrus communis TaxID=23211 RepID=UPI0035C15CF0